MFPSSIPVDGYSAASIELKTSLNAAVRRTVPVYVGALALLAARYSVRDEILIADSWLDESGAARPLFYRCEVHKEQSVASFVDDVAAEIQMSRSRVPYSYKELAALLQLDEHAALEIGFSTDHDVRTRVEGFRVSLIDDEPALRILLSYNDRRISREWIERFGRHYQRALSFLSESARATLGELDLLSEEEKRRVAIQFNRTDTDYSSGKTLHGLVQECAAANAGSIAVIFENETLSYDGLNRQANRLAHFLRARLDVHTGERVGVMMRRSTGMIVALLGVMKAGAAYVPINPMQPWATSSYMIDNAGVKTLIVDSDSVSQAAVFSGELFVADVELQTLDTSEANPDLDLPGASLAYVIYTSGSTGLPKGVAVGHSAIVNTILWRNEFYRFDDSDVSLQIPSFAFDSSVVDIFCALCAGGRLIIPREELRLDAQYLKEMIGKHGVTRLILTPSYYKVLMRDLGEAALRSITVAGEATTLEMVSEHYKRIPQAAIYNEYGPTENAVCSTACVLQPGDKTVQIGRPISNVKVFVVDENMKILPAGMPGEIVLGGAGLALGYLNQSELTAERFIPSPFSEVYSGRLYRTGDWGYWTADGALEFLGRLDNQVKIHGFRIELSGIEAKLAQHPGVKGAAVVCKELGGDRYLAAYVSGSDSLVAAELRAALSAHLPHYMVPEIIRVLPELPLNLNGKVDRKILKGLKDHVDGAAFDLPADETETALAAICSDLLKRARPAVTDNLFDHGLTSLKVMEMISRIRNEMRADVSFLDVYTFPTIKALSRRIGAASWKTMESTTESLT